MRRERSGAFVTNTHARRARTHSQPSSLTPSTYTTYPPPPRFKDGAPHGRGAECQKGAYEYEGPFQNGLRHSRSAGDDGTCRYADGSTYVGAWRLGRRAGRGRLEAADGTVLEGEFEDDVPHGEGEEQGGKPEGGKEVFWV